jgi:hypothetical protein
MRGRSLRNVVLLGAASLVVLGAAAHAAHADDATSVSGSSSPSGTTTTGPPTTARATAALRIAAASWAKAFLTGTADDIRRLQGPECRSTSASSSLPRATVALYLRGLRASMRRQLGKPLGQIHVRGVELRNVTGDHGEAQVVYDLPQQKVGNDNWVEFAPHGGHWRVSNCKAPILGNSTSATESAVPAAPSTAAPTRP